MSKSGFPRLPFRRGVPALAALGLLASGCLEFNPFLPYDHGPVHEDRGPLVATDAARFPGAAHFPGAGQLWWSADGAALLYAAISGDGASTSVAAVRVRDGVRRTVDPGPLWNGAPLARSADGTALYAVLATAAGSALRELLSGRDLLTPAPPTGHALLLSPDARALLYSDATGRRLLDLAAGMSAPVPCGEPIAFSPDGAELLCTAPPPDGGLVLITLALGQRTPLPLDWCPWKAARWDGDGPRLLGESTRPYGLAVGAPLTGEVRVLQGVGGISPVVSAYDAYAFSPDGKAAAFFVTECLAGGLLSCSRSESRLVLVDLATGTERVIASGPSPTGAIAFSDDGKQIAYQYGSALHVRPTGL
jgi:hypothetical protein